MTWIIKILGENSKQKWTHSKKVWNWLKSCLKSNCAMLLNLYIVRMCTFFKEIYCFFSQCAKCFTFIISFNPCSDSASLICIFMQDNTGSERFSSLFNVKQLVRSQTHILRPSHFKLCLIFLPDCRVNWLKTKCSPQIMPWNYENGK